MRLNFITIFFIIPASLVATTLLLLSIFIPHTGESTRFIQRISSVYFVYYLWLESTSILIRYESILPINTLLKTPWVIITHTITIIEFSIEDNLFFRFFFIYILIIIIIFFFSVAEYFFISKKGRPEFPILIFFIIFGGIFTLRLYTFIDLLIALEIVTLTSYVLVTFERQNRFSTYAGVQYFILGSLPSAGLLLAFGFFYLQGGSLILQDLDLLFNTTFTRIDFLYIKFNQIFYLIYDYIILSVITYNDNLFQYINQEDKVYNIYFSNIKLYTIFNRRNSINILTLIALVFLFFNFLFKLTAAPFHVWAPSVYGKAPIVSVIFLSIYSKILIFFLFFKLLNTFLHTFSFFIRNFLLIIGILSIFIGILGAFIEKLIKRFFIYSSIGHVGFRLIGLSLLTLEGSSAIFHYLAVYIISSFGRWFLLLIIGRNKNHLVHFAELKNNDPFISLFFAFLIFSISGIPPLGGFFIKLDILSALLDTSHFFINYILFFFTVASFFYYLRIIKILFFDIQTIIRSNQVILDSLRYPIEFSYYTGRLWRMSIIFIILGLYIFLIQKELLYIQYEVLVSFN